MIGIYKITNLINNKIYIGQSKNIEKRWAKHRTGPFNPNNNCYNNALYRSIRKYGLDNFTFEVIEQCKEADLNKKEIYWINYYDSHNKDKGYNLTDGGDGLSNPDEETKYKCGSQWRGKTQPQEMIDYVINHW